MIGKLYSTVIDCPDPLALGEFYAGLFGGEAVVDSDRWVDLDTGGERPLLSFQRAPDHRPPRWPDPDFPQQYHLDVLVDDLDLAEEQVLALGGVRLPNPQETFRVFADPAGHPFCLVLE